MIIRILNLNGFWCVCIRIMSILSNLHFIFIVKSIWSDLCVKSTDECELKQYQIELVEPSYWKHDSLRLSLFNAVLMWCCFGCRHQISTHLWIHSVYIAKKRLTYFKLIWLALEIIWLLVFYSLSMVFCAWNSRNSSRTVSKWRQVKATYICFNLHKWHKLSEFQYTECGPLHNGWCGNWFVKRCYSNSIIRTGSVSFKYRKSLLWDAKCIWQQITTKQLCKLKIWWSSLYCHSAENGCF